MKTVFKLLSAIFLCAFCVSLGVYAGENIYKDKVELSEQRYEDVQTIAVVNLDEGIDVNGEKVYYSNDLINLPNERFIRSSFEEAKRGIDNGAFAAYILIPATFSKSVEGLLFVLTALIGVGSKEEKITDLNPNKLVYDIFGNVDEIEPDPEREECNVSYEGDEVEADFLSQYKSLCGHLLQKKYKYEDYLKGGLSLLKKDKGLRKLYEAKETSEVLEILKDKYEKEYQEVYISSCKINRKKYLTIKWALVLVSVLLVGAISYICVNHVRQKLCE